jgi:hypothetical protein
MNIAKQELLAPPLAPFLSQYVVRMRNGVHACASVSN